MNIKSDFGVLLVNLGTPEKPDAKHIRQFLREFLSDPRVIDLPRPLWSMILNGFILPFRPHKIKHAYQKIWTNSGSPLRYITLEQQAMLKHKLNEFYDAQIPVEIGMTYGQPTLREGLLKLRQHQVTKVIILPLYPQYSATTTASIFDKVAELLKKCPCLPEIRMVNHYYANPTYIAAVAQSIQAYQLSHGKPEQLIFSFHGIPQRYANKGDPYPLQCHETARLIAQELNLEQDEWKITFQSRLGRAEWLKPYTDKTLAALAQQGVKNVQVSCPGFAVDCLETLEEIALQNRDTFFTNGGEKYAYIPALNAERSHIELLAQLIQNQAQSWV